jgi:glutamyl-tRNA reductase
MQLHAEHIINRFCVAGINHTCANAGIRGTFSVDNAIHVQILEQAKANDLKSVFVVSTCNRTEIYGYAHHPCELAALLTRFTKGSMDIFMQHSYRYQGSQALQHLFHVACGLNSQIVGDYEIQGQLKKAFTVAHQQDMIGPIMDRTINFVFQASKKIRSHTALSTGTVSVSFAAIEWLQKNIGKKATNILLIGSGKFGRNVCKNLRHYLPGTALSITNRTAAHGKKLAEETGSAFIDYGQLAEAVNQHDVILVCTNAMEPVIKASFFNGLSKHIVIDLSVPSNVEGAVSEIAGIQVVNVDEISAITKNTIAKRSLEVPKAEAIIADFEMQFIDWLQTYQHAAAIRHIKENLYLLSGTRPNSKCEMSKDWETGLPVSSIAYDVQIQKTVSSLVYNLKTKKEKGCQFITAYHAFLCREEAV